MARLNYLLSSALLFAAAQAHFTLDYPDTIGFDDDNEGTSPCGGYKPDFASNNLTKFHVGGDAVALTLAHPEAKWLFRATLDESASNWTQVFPIVQQSGLGKFCEPAISVPAEWAGHNGVISVVADAPDGLLYQCASVSFIEGTGSPPNKCSNATITVSFTSDSSLSALVGAGTNSTSTSNSSTTSSGAAATSTSTAKPNAASVVGPAMRVLSAALMAVAFF